MNQNQTYSLPTQNITSSDTSHKIVFILSLLLLFVAVALLGLVLWKLKQHENNKNKLLFNFK